jgi:hypothetical protein
VSQVAAFAELAGAGHVVLFLHDPVRGDEVLEVILAEWNGRNHGSPVGMSIAAEERSYTLEKGVLTVGPLPAPA